MKTSFLHPEKENMFLVCLNVNDVMILERERESTIKRPARNNQLRISDDKLGLMVKSDSREAGSLPG